MIRAPILFKGKVFYVVIRILHVDYILYSRNRESKKKPRSPLILICTYIRFGVFVCVFVYVALEATVFFSFFLSFSFLFFFSFPPFLHLLPLKSFIPPICKLKILFSFSPKSISNRNYLASTWLLPLPVTSSISNSH